MASACLALIRLVHLHQVTLAIRQIRPYLALLAALLVHFQQELRLAGRQLEAPKPLRRVEACFLALKEVSQAILPLVLRTLEALDRVLLAASDPPYSPQM